MFLYHSALRKRKIIVNWCIGNRYNK